MPSAARNSNGFNARNRIVSAVKKSGKNDFKQCISSTVCRHRPTANDRGFLVKRESLELPRELMHHSGKMELSSTCNEGEEQQPR